MKYSVVEIKTNLERQFAQSADLTVRELTLNSDACVKALVVPGRSGGWLGFLKPDREGCVIDWERVRRIGDDVILVEVDADRGC